MAELRQPDIPDDAAEWYSSRRSDTLRQVESGLNQLAEGYSALDNAWNSLNERENIAHDELNTRDIVAIQAERQRLQSEAAQIQNGWHNLQIEKHKLEQSNEPKFLEILNSSSHPAQMFLRAHRDRLENDPTALRQLLFADARARASGLTVDGKHYFAALEAAVGLDASDRSLDDFSELSDEMRQSRNATRREATGKVKATEAQRVMAKNLPGVSEDEYLKACASPFSQAASVTIEPDELSLGQSSKGMQVSLDETPKKTIDHSKYKPSQRSMTLSAAQVALCKDMGVDPIDYVKNSLKVKNGETTHQWYEQRLKSQGLA